MFQPGENWTGPPMAVLLNKADLLTPERLAELEDWYKSACRWDRRVGRFRVPRLSSLALQS